MGTNRSIEPSSDELYAINDAISQLAAQIHISERRGFDTDDEYDDMLNEATHAAAAVLFGATQGTGNQDG